MISQVLLLTVLTVVTAQELPAQQELEAPLRAALSDLEQRDPETARQITARLTDAPGEARRRLAHHARYLQQKERARTESPDFYRLLLEQEDHERAVRGTVEAYHRSGDETERQAFETELRALLTNWFETRHALRLRELQTMEQDRKAVGQEERGERADLEAWLQRVAAHARSPEPPRGQANNEVAPLVVQQVMRRDPLEGERLVRLSREAPQRFMEELQRLIQRQPELLQEARRRVRGDEGQGQAESEAKLHEAIRRAAELVRPHLRVDGTVVVPEGERETVDRALREIVDAESALVRSHLARADQRIAKMRRLVERRSDDRAFIVELQLARFLGEPERYDW